jgi:sigma-B regulation protein RsbU (phosphoserine phosphatase)
MVRRTLATKPDRQALRKRLNEVELLIKSSHALNSTLDLDRLLNVITRIVRDAFRVETASVLFLDSSGQNMVFQVARGKRGRQIVGLQIPVGEGVVGWVAQHKKPLIVNDLRNDPRYSSVLEKTFGLNTDGIMSIPLMRRGKMIGVVEAVNRRNGEDFTDDDLRLFTALGDHIATAIENASLYEEAERNRLEAAQLYEVSVALAESLTLNETLDKILTSLKRLIHYDAAALFVLEARSQELVSHFQKGYHAKNLEKLRLKLDDGLVGWAAKNKQGTIVADVRQDKRYIAARGRTRSEIVTPMLSRGRVIGLFNLESNKADAYRERDLRLLESFAAQAAVSIERARLYEEGRVKREIERELKLARTIQAFFTPRRSQKVGKYTLTARNYPSLELSGDYVDVYPLEKPYTAFAIADVAGKGVPASIIMASFRSTLHTVAPHFTSAREIALRANQILLETVRPEDFVTAFIGVLDRTSGEVTYCNAGHEPPILMRPNGRYRLLHAGGPMLGAFELNDLEEGRFVMEDNFFFAYTDGATDALNPKGQPFGPKRLIRYLKDHRGESSLAICTGLHRHLRDFMNGAPQADDQTFLAIK